MYETRPADAGRFADLARQAVADGFTAFKSMAVPETAPIEGLQPIRYAEACVAAMREAVGDRIDIMVDCHARPSPRMGVLFARRWNRSACTSSRNRAGPRTSTAWPKSSAPSPRRSPPGERLISQHAFRELLEKRACSVLQPDITHCGGLSEARRIAAMAEAYRVALAPHNPQGPVSTAASLEFGFATPSYIICETVHLDVPWRHDVVGEGFVVATPIVRPNTRPGLGIEINEDEVRRHPFQQELLQRSFYPDGAVGDW